MGVDAPSIDALRGALTRALDEGRPLLPLPADEAAARSLRPLAGRAARPGTAVVIATSGSTGAVKGVEIGAGALRASANATIDALGGPGEWLLALPPHHVAGLQVVVRAALTAERVEPVAGSFTAASFLAGCAGLTPGSRRYVSLVPTQLRRLLEPGGPALAALRDFAGVLVGGAAAGPGLLDRAAAGGVRVLTTYGMSETCGGCVYDGRGLDGVRVRLDADGVIELGGPVLASGYLGDEGGTAAAFRHGWLLTSDLGTLDPDGRLTVLGRADDMIITGGEKIAPVLVERALLELPGVHDACVLGVPEEEFGQAVGALVVADRELTLREVRAEMTARLGRAFAPRRVRAVAALPLLASGKPDREAVRRLLREAG